MCPPSFGQEPLSKRDILISVAIAAACIGVIIFGVLLLRDAVMYAS